MSSVASNDHTNQFHWLPELNGTIKLTVLKEWLEYSYISKHILFCMSNVWGHLSRYSMISKGVKGEVVHKYVFG